MTKKKKYKENIIWVLFGLTAAVSLYLIIVLGLWIYFTGRAYPGTRVAGVSVTGKTQKELETIIEERSQVVLGGNITFTASKDTLVATKDLKLTVDAPKTAKNILSWGSSNPFVLGSAKSFPVVFKADDADLFGVISRIADENTTTATDPVLKLQGGDIVISAGSDGNRVNLAETVASFYDSLGNLDSTVPVHMFKIEPSFTSEEAIANKENIAASTAIPLTLTAADKTFVVDQATQVSWVALSGTQPSLAQRFGDDPLLSLFFDTGATRGLFSGQNVANYLTELSGKINAAPVSAELTVLSGKVAVQKASQNGQTLDISQSTIDVLEALGTKSGAATLTVEVARPEVREDNLADLGITELVSSGNTNFSGSPKNRIHNVKTGAARFDGVLIRPGEEFSFNKALGPVDASTGYLPELVILEDKTVPEYGGGMCQVSSTAFRAALNGGLPILERLYHAYPVSYYKPYGVDATVYLPKPDLVFKNDTGHYILIQTHIEGYSLTFDFYGTRPARTVSFAGNADAKGAVPNVERITPLIYDQGVRGKGSFTAQFWRFIYDPSGKLILKSSWVSKYDSPLKYPH